MRVVGSVGVCDQRADQARSLSPVVAVTTRGGRLRSRWGGIRSGSLRTSSRRWRSSVALRPFPRLDWRTRAVAAGARLG